MGMLPAYRRQRSGVQIPPWVEGFFSFYPIPGISPRKIQGKCSNENASQVYFLLSLHQGRNGINDCLQSCLG